LPVFDPLFVSVGRKKKESSIKLKLPHLAFFCGRGNYHTRGKENYHWEKVCHSKYVAKGCHSE